MLCLCFELVFAWRSLIRDTYKSDTTCYECDSDVVTRTKQMICQNLFSWLLYKRDNAEESLAIFKNYLKRYWNNPLKFLSDFQKFLYLIEHIYKESKKKINSIFNLPLDVCFDSKAIYIRESYIFVESLNIGSWKSNVIILELIQIVSMENAMLAFTTHSLVLFLKTSIVIHPFSRRQVRYITS